MIKNHQSKHHQMVMEYVHTTKNIIIYHQKSLRKNLTKLNTLVQVNPIAVHTVDKVDILPAHMALSTISAINKRHRKYVEDTSG